MKKVFIVLMVLLFSSCGSVPLTTQKQPGTKVLIPHVPIKIHGIAALSPQDGDDWYFQRGSRNMRVNFTKAGLQPYESVIASTFLYKLKSYDSVEQLLKNVSDDLANGTDPNRFNVIEQDTSIHQVKNDMTCIKYSLLMEDTKPKSVDQAMHLRSVGYICPHPDGKKKAAVDSSLSARYFPDNNGFYSKGLLDAKLQSYFDKLIFEKFNR